MDCPGYCQKRCRACTISLGSFWHPRPPVFACLGGPKPEVSVPPPAQKRLERGPGGHDGSRAVQRQRPGCRGPTIWLFNIRLGFLSQFGLLLTVPFQKLFYVLGHWGANTTVRTTGHTPETTAHVVSTLGGKVPGTAGVCPYQADGRVSLGRGSSVSTQVRVRGWALSGATRPESLRWVGGQRTARGRRYSWLTLLC